MVATRSRVTGIFFILLISQLSACYQQGNKPAPTTLNSFAKGIAFDNDDNLYIATVSGNIFRHDGDKLHNIIAKGTAGLDLAESVRYAQGTLYIHNKRYAGPEQGYVDEILLFNTDGEFIDQLVTETDIQGKNFIDISVNATAQLFSLTDANTARIFRINQNKFDLSKFDLASEPEFTDLLNQYAGLAEAVNPQQTESPVATDTDTVVLIQQHLGEENTSQIDNLDIGIVETSVNTLPALFFTPTGITTDTVDNIYVSFLQGVYKFTANGRFIKPIVNMDEHGFNMTNKMTVDPYGNLVVANMLITEESTQLNFLKFDADGNYLGVFIPAGAGGIGNSIQDIAFDSAGNFYIVDMLKGVYKFDSSGQFDSLLLKTYERK